MFAVQQARARSPLAKNMLIAGLVAAVAVLLLVAAAGGAGKPAGNAKPATGTAAPAPAPAAASPGTGQVLTATVYRQKANAICAALWREPHLQNLQDWGPYIEKTAIPEMRVALSGLGRLRPPAAFASTVEAAIPQMQSELPLMGQIGTAASAGDKAGVLNTYEQLGGVAQAANATWKQIGVAC